MTEGTFFEKTMHCTTLQMVQNERTDYLQRREMYRFIFLKKVP